ncbi:hypothetical protein BJY01DRAFT_246639 [Aspergillus pseudoustus]|uniref:Uncharacterized protein n=1 Tax=Aspergillus pseudoustus TaxID=1810923 RepID=A0ABR4K813_9EURO
MPEESLNSVICEEGQPPSTYLYQYFHDWTKDRLPEPGDWFTFDPKTDPKPGALSIHLEDVGLISGPGCRYTNAYIGNRISCAEMQGCTTVQCLVPKPKAWEPAPDDQELERDSKYFLSGICSGVSYRIGGYVPVDDLANFFRHTNARAFLPIRRNFRLLDRDWVHSPGEEWLAANPFYISRLGEFLEDDSAPDNAAVFHPRCDVLESVELYPPASAHRNKVSPSGTRMAAPVPLAANMRFELDGVVVHRPRCLVYERLLEGRALGQSVEIHIPSNTSGAVARVRSGVISSFFKLTTVDKRLYIRGDVKSVHLPNLSADTPVSLNSTYKCEEYSTLKDVTCPIPPSLTNKERIGRGVGIAAGVVCVVLAVWFLWRRRRKSREKSMEARNGADAGVDGTAELVALSLSSGGTVSGVHDKPRTPPPPYAP